MKPKVFATCSEMARYRDGERAAGRTIGFVPTMGALHDGHRSLMERARVENDVVVASIFVNPTQFGPREDFSKYPRPFERDIEICGEAGVDAIFAPDPPEMYPAGFDTYVVQEKLVSVLCGASRPGHFRGVLTVCCKLFNIVGPHVAYLGQKDYQQTVVIRRMVRDLAMPLRIEVCPTVRESDGLAMSSRNRYLKPDERREALCLHRALQLARAMAAGGTADSASLIAAMQEAVRASPSARIDYVAIVHPESLEPVARLDGPAVAAIAAQIGSTRLIDNMIIGPPPGRP